MDDARNDARTREEIERERRRRIDERQKRGLHVGLFMAAGLSQKEAEKKYEATQALPHDSDGFLLTEEDKENEEGGEED